jgi:hypothetical protein
MPDDDVPSRPGTINAQSRRPSSARYRALVRTLEAVDCDVIKNEIAFSQATIDMLAAFYQFLRSDPGLGPDRATVTLRRLMVAMHDTTKGSRRTVLTVRAGRKAGRPTNQIHYTQRGGIVAALDILIRAKMPSSHAAKTIEKMLVKAGVRWEGKVISARQILQWRRQTNDNAPRASDEAARDIVAARKALLSGQPGTLEMALEDARRVIGAAARWNSN